MHFFKPAFSLALLAGSALAQLTHITYPSSGSTLTAGGSTTVQVSVVDYPENVDVVATVIGVAQCHGDECSPASSFVGNILYQGPYTPDLGKHYANFTVTIPASFPLGNASLNVINLYLVGSQNEPEVDYLSENVAVVA